MFTTICMYFGLLIVGAILSYKGLISDKINNKLSKIQMFFLFVLIFVMGIRLGMNEEVINSLTTIGIKAFIFSLATIAGSIICVYIVNKKVKLLDTQTELEEDIKND